jgi:hypothetical protein
MSGVTRMSNRKIILLISLLALLILPITLTAQDGGARQVNVRFAHFAPDAPPVDVYIDGELSDIEAFEYGDVSEWMELSAGTHILAIVPSGSGINAAVLGPDEYNLPASEWLTIAAIGSIEDDTLTAAVLTQDFDELPDGEARLSLFNAIESSPELNLRANDNLLFEGVNYPGTSAGDEGDLNDGFVSANTIAGTYDLTISTDDESDDTVLELEDVMLDAGTVYLLAVIGAVDDPDTVLLATDLAALGVDTDMAGDELGTGSGFLRIAHLSSGTPEVDVYIDGDLYADSVEFATITDFDTFDAGAYTVSISPADTSAENAVLGPIEVPVATDTWVTLAIIGTLSNNTLSLQVLAEDLTGLPETDAYISVFQAIPGGGAVDVQLANGTPLIRLLAFPGSLGENDGLGSVQLVADSYHVQIVETNNPSSVLVDLDNLRLTGGRYYFIAAIVAEPPFVLVVAEITMPEDSE